MVPVAPLISGRRGDWEAIDIMEVRSGGVTGCKTNGLAAKVSTNESAVGAANENKKKESRLSAVDLLAVEADGKIRFNQMMLFCNQMMLFCGFPETTPLVDIQIISQIVLSKCKHPFSLHILISFSSLMLQRRRD